MSVCVLLIVWLSGAQSGSGYGSHRDASIGSAAQTQHCCPQEQFERRHWEVLECGEIMTTSEAMRTMTKVTVTMTVAMIVR